MKKISNMTNIAIFASGTGTNTINIIQYFLHSEQIRVGAIFCNSNTAKVIERASEYNINCHIFSKEELNDKEGVYRILKEENIDFIVLAGFLQLIPEHIINHYNNKIINIHPALMPKFSGKGMYGMNVHKAVIEAKEKETGITIHLVNEQYDEGAIIFQAKCQVTESDTPESVAEKVHALEYEFFPKVIEEYINKV